MLTEATHLTEFEYYFGMCDGVCDYLLSIYLFIYLFAQHNIKYTSASATCWTARSQSDTFSCHRPKL